MSGSKGTTIPNFIHFGLAVQKLIGGVRQTDRPTDRPTDRHRPPVRSHKSKFISAKHGVKAKLTFPLLENNCATIRGPWDQLGEEGLVNIMEKYKSGTVVIH